MRSGSATRLEERPFAASSASTRAATVTNPLVVHGSTSASPPVSPLAAGRTRPPPPSGGGATGGRAASAFAGIGLGPSGVRRPPSPPGAGAAEASQNVRTSFDALRALGIIALDAPQDLVHFTLLVFCRCCSISRKIDYIVRNYCTVLLRIQR